MEFLLEFEHAYEFVDRGFVSEGGDGLGERWLSLDTAAAPLCRRHMGWQGKGAAGTGVAIERQGVFTGVTELVLEIARGATKDTVVGIE
jgi:hypothetical protein